MSCIGQSVYCLSWQEHAPADQGLTQTNGTLTTVDPQPASADLLHDLFGPLAIEGPPVATVQSEQNAVSGLEEVLTSVDGAAIVPVGEQTNSAQVVLLFLFVYRKFGGCG